MAKLIEKSHRLRVWALQSGSIRESEKREKFKVVSCKKESRRNSEKGSIFFAADHMGR